MSPEAHSKMLESIARTDSKREEKFDFIDMGIFVENVPNDELSFRSTKKKIKGWNRVYSFYNAPIVKFINHFVISLIVYDYIILLFDSKIKFFFFLDILYSIFGILCRLSAIRLLSGDGIVDHGHSHNNCWQIRFHQGHNLRAAHHNFCARISIGRNKICELIFFSLFLFLYLQQQQHKKFQIPLKFLVKKAGDKKLKTKIKYFFMDNHWNIYDVFLFMEFYLTLIIRFLPLFGQIVYFGSTSCYEVARRVEH